MYQIFFVLFIVIICLEIIFSLWNILRYFAFIKIIKRNKVSKEITLLDNIRILIIIPCLREQDIIIKTINHFINMMDDNINVSLIVVTTRKEVYEKNRNLNLVEELTNDILKGSNIDIILNKYNTILSRTDVEVIFKIAQTIEGNFLSEKIKEYISNSYTTYELLKNEMESNLKYKSKIILVDYPYSEGMMSHQLNYVLENLRNLCDFDFRDETTYVGIYNADSLPEKSTLEKLAILVNTEHYPYVIQQYSAFISNFHNLSWLMKGFSIYQTNFEIKNGLFNSLMPSCFLKNHVVGHGLYIRLDQLIQMGGFETRFWCEDIYMSFYLRNRKIFVRPLMVLENAEAPQYLKNQIKQHATWFTTAFQSIRMFISILRAQKSVSIFGILYFLQQARGTISWLLSPLIICFSFSFFLFSKDIFALITSIAAYTLMSFCTYYTTIRVIEVLDKIKLENKLRLILFSSASFLISNWGPLYNLFHKKNQKHKTIR